MAYGVDVGLGESDNVTLVPTHKVSQTLAVADVDFALQEQRRLFDVTAKGDFTYLDFVQGAYSPELIGRFDGLAHMALIPDKLTWVVRDDFGQAAIDPFAATTPTNLENINFFSTGPDVKARLGALGFIDVSARYARTQYQVSPFDNNQFAASLAVGKPLSAFSEVSMNGTGERVLFDNTLSNTDFNRYSFYGHYELAGLRTGITANLGIIQVSQDIRMSAGPLAKIQLSRKLSTAADLIFVAGRTITDASASFSSLQSGPIGTIGNAAASLTSANYKVTYLSGEWKYIRNRTTLDLSANWEKDNYIDVSPLTLTRETVELNIERRLSPALTVQLLGRVLKNHYLQQNFDGTDEQIGTRLTLHEGHGLEFRFEYNHSARSVSGIGDGYGENRVFLTVGYRPKPMTQPNYNPGRIGRPGPGINP